MTSLAELSDLSDNELACLAKTDTEALEYLFGRYKQFIKLKARSYFLIGADSEDLIQEGMIGLYHAVVSYLPDKEASFRSFAELCVTRRLITAVKASTRLKHQPLNTYISINMPVSDGSDDRTIGDMVSDDGSTNPEDMLIDLETAADTHNRIMSVLSPFEKNVAELFIYGMGYQQIAEKLNKSPKSIDNALQRIKNKVQGLM